MAEAPDFDMRAGCLISLQTHAAPWLDLVAWPVAIATLSSIETRAAPVAAARMERMVVLVYEP